MANQNNSWKKHYLTEEDKKAIEEREHEDDHLFDHYTLVATKGQKPLRVDKFLSNLLPFTSRSKIKNASQTGSISVNGKEVKVSYKVKPDDIVKLMLPYPPSPELEAEDIPLDIAFEDEYIILVRKPPGMVCHPSLGHRSGTLVHALLWHFGQLPQPEGEKEISRPGLVHRIDRDTSGILVIAKTEYGMAHLSKQFFDRTTDRTYQALVWGDVKEQEGTVVAHIGRSKANRKIFHAYPEGATGKHAITHYKVLERFGVVTLIQCKLETGRTHQIRVHMKYLGHSLFQDKEYGGNKILCGPKTKRYQQFIRNCFDVMPRQALHAKTLAFTHPISEMRMEFDTDLPLDFAAVLEKFRSKSWV